MASTCLSLLTAPNFSGDNYDFWATKMRRFLMANDLWDLLDEGFEPPVANERRTEEQQKISNENSSKDAKALFILQSAVSDKIFPSIMNATTAKQAWTILQSENQDTKKKEGKDWMDSMRAMQYYSGEKSNISGVSIVPDKLRKDNENSFEPKLISIGPRFRGTRRDLLKMEKIKWDIMLYLLHRVGGNAEGNLAMCGEHILGLEKEVRESYVDGLKQMEWKDIANIMLYDACLVLELLSSDVVVISMYSLSLEERDKVLSDLWVLDNQIPFFILRDLYCQLFGGEGAAIETRALNHFGYRIPDGDILSENTKNASNFVELVHSYISMDLKGSQESNHILEITEGTKPVQLGRCATMLRAAGVKINPGSFVLGRKALDFSIGFNNSTGTLVIPNLCITETTKAQWLNLIAWEHHNMGTNETFICKCTSAALFFNALICCESDVQLLQDKGIIWDYLDMSNKDLVTFFRSIIHGINHDKINSRYFNFDALNKYCSHPIRHGTLIPTRLWHYLTGSPREALRDLHNFLKHGYNYAAALITILSLLQTIYAVLSYHHPKK